MAECIDIGGTHTTLHWRRALQAPFDTTRIIHVCVCKSFIRMAPTWIRLDLPERRHKILICERLPEASDFLHSLLMIMLYI